MAEGVNTMALNQEHLNKAVPHGSSPAYRAFLSFGMCKGLEQLADSRGFPRTPCTFLPPQCGPCRRSEIFLGTTLDTNQMKR